MNQPKPGGEKIKFCLYGNNKGIDQSVQQHVFTSREERVISSYFSYISTKTDVVGTQKNRLNEMVLFSTQNTFFN